VWKRVNRGRPAWTNPKCTLLVPMERPFSSKNRTICFQTQLNKYLNKSKHWWKIVFCCFAAFAIFCVCLNVSVPITIKTQAMHKNVKKVAMNLTSVHSGQYSCTIVQVFKENVSYPVSTCRNPFSLILRTRWQFSLILGTQFSFFGPLKHLKNLL